MAIKPTCESQFRSLRKLSYWSMRKTCSWKFIMYTKDCRLISICYGILIKDMLLFFTTGVPSSQKWMYHIWSICCHSVCLFSLSQCHFSLTIANDRYSHKNFDCFCQHFMHLKTPYFIHMQSNKTSCCMMFKNSWAM